MAIDRLDRAYKTYVNKIKIYSTLLNTKDDHLYQSQDEWKGVRRRSKNEKRKKNKV